MSDPQKDDEAKFNETLKRMLATKPTPHKPKPDGAAAKAGHGQGALLKKKP